MLRFRFFRKGIPKELVQAVFILPDAFGIGTGIGGFAQLDALEKEAAELLDIGEFENVVQVFLVGSSFLYEIVQGLVVF